MYQIYYKEAKIQNPLNNFSSDKWGISLPKPGHLSLTSNNLEFLANMSATPPLSIKG